MSKKIVLLLALLLTVSSTSVFAKKIDRSGGEEAGTKRPTVQLDKDTVFYPKATVKSAIAKYKAENYTGCLQELFSVTKKDPSNALAYYYMAMTYTHLDMKDEAVEAYEKVIALNADDNMVAFAVKGRDCLTGGPACATSANADEMDALDAFINAPYGEDGMSPELIQQVKQKELSNIQKTINKKDKLESDDIQRIKEFDIKNNQSLGEESIKIAQVSDEEVLGAINTLKEAGLNLTVQSDNSYASQFQDPRMAEMSMLLGNNNYRNNSMMDMLPMLMTKAEKGENIDPRFVQTMMMNSMMSDFTNFNTDNNNRY